MISSNKVHPSISRVSRTDMKYAISYYRTGCMPTDCDQQRCKSWLNSWLNEKNDISSLLKWAETWQMRFNSKKCHILSISRQRNKSSPVYYLGTDVQYTPIHNIISLKIVITQVHNFTFFCVKKHLPFIHY